MKTLHAKSKITITSKEDGFKFIASSEAVDRHGEVIKQDGWDLKNYLLNPVILWGHDYWKMPIGKATRIYVEDKKLIVEGVWASEKANPEAEQIRNLYLEGMINTVSVGFIAKEYEGNVITKAELLEISLVTVPANQEALSVLKSKGFSDDIMKGFVVEIKEEGDDAEVEITEDEKEEEVVEEKKDEEIVEEKKEVEEEVVGDVEDVVEDTAPITPAVDEEEEGVELVDEDDADELDTNEEILDNEEKGVKAGRTLSASTRAAIVDALEAMKNAATNLEILLQESDTPKAVNGKSIIYLKEGEIVVDRKEMLEVLAELRGNDKRNEAAVSKVKSILK